MVAKAKATESEPRPYENWGTVQVKSELRRVIADKKKVTAKNLSEASWYCYIQALLEDEIKRRGLKLRRKRK